MCACTCIGWHRPADMGSALGEKSYWQQEQKVCVCVCSSCWPCSKDFGHHHHHHHHHRHRHRHRHRHQQQQQQKQKQEQRQQEVWLMCLSLLFLPSLFYCIQQKAGDLCNLVLGSSFCEQACNSRACRVGKDNGENTSIFDGTFLKTSVFCKDPEASSCPFSSLQRVLKCSNTHANHGWRC